MCVMSAVIKDWGPYIPTPSQPWPISVPLQPPVIVPSTGTPTQWPITTPTQEPQVAEGVSNDDLRELTDALKVALEAAARFDKAAGMEDCEDDDLKTDILDRLVEIERRLDDLERWRNS